MDHSQYDSSYIADILRQVKVIALVGASANNTRPSNLVVKYLMSKGYQMVPVNPGLAGSKLLGQMVYANLSEIPFPIDMVDIFRNSEAALSITQQALNLATLPKVIWMQLGVINHQAAELAETAGVKVVMNRCPKIEYGKHSGEWAWVGGYSGMISSKKQNMHGNGKMQSLGLGLGPGIKR